MTTTRFNTTDIRAFRRKMREWGRKRTLEEVTLFQRRVAAEAFVRITQKTPVDTGRARGNWQMGIDTPPDTILERFAQNNETTEIELTKLNTLGPYRIVYVINNIPYIIPLENGHSQRAPNGMVGVTIEELNAIF